MYSPPSTNLVVVAIGDITLGHLDRTDQAMERSTYLNDILLKDPFRIRSSLSIVASW